jgi:hypothetical protein
MSTTDFSDEELRRRTEIAWGLTMHGMWLAEKVNESLHPALIGRRVKACPHVMDAATADKPNHKLAADERRAIDATVYVCPDHPHRLLCSLPGCLPEHWRLYHRDESPDGRCFVCGADVHPDLEQPIWAVIQLHRALPVRHGTDRFFTYVGELKTWPVTFLCLDHAGSVDLPIRMIWPTNS